MNIGSKIALTVLGLILAIAFLTDLGPLPSWLIQFQHIKASELTNFQRIQVEQSLRGTVLQALAGVLLVSGAIATWSQVTTANRTLALSRSTRATEVFAKGIEQISSPSSATRVGGLYALDRIATADRTEDVRIANIFATFVRETANTNTLADVSADTQIALELLTQRRSPEPVNLSNARLRGVRLPSGHLENANLENAILHHSSLHDADLHGACLLKADLRSADLANANLSKADLRGCDLREANLVNAKLEGVNFDGSTEWPDGFAAP